MTHLNNPLAIEWQRLGELGKGLIPVRLPHRGMAADIPDVIDDLELIGKRFKMLLEVYQSEVCGSFSEVDRDYFKQLTDMMEDGMHQLVGHLQDVQYELEQVLEAAE